MIKFWVLIIVFKMGYAGGTTTATFYDRESCEKAAAWVNDLRTFPQTNVAAARCFQRRTPLPEGVR